MRDYSIAIVGATGLVGSTLLSLLKERSFPIKDLYLLASQQSSQKSMQFNEKIYPIQDLAAFDFKQTKLSFFCVSKALAEHYVPKAVEAGNIVIDKSNCYRTHDDIPLIIPEVNADALVGFQNRNIVANPNCNTIPIAVALKPIYDAVGIKRMNIATYQSVSGTGRDAVSELTQQVSDFVAKRTIQSKVYNQQIAFNVLPHIDDFEENGYTKEEMKIILEMKKIFQDDSLAINPTAVRVPVFYGHAASVHIETDDKITKNQALFLLSKARGVKLLDDQYAGPTPLQDAAGKDSVYVGRIREDVSYDKGLNLWVVADNLRKGAALNAIQIAEHLIKEKW